MTSRPLLRDLALLSFALVLGWWAHGTATVHAKSSDHSSADEPTPDFQLSPINRDTALTIYNPANHTLYVYPAVQTGSSNINCEFSLHVAKPGAPIQRENCAIGPTYSQH